MLSYEARHPDSALRQRGDPTQLRNARRPASDAGEQPAHIRGGLSLSPGCGRLRRRDPGARKGRAARVPGRRRRAPASWQSDSPAGLVTSPATARTSESERARMTDPGSVSDDLARCGSGQASLLRLLSSRAPGTDPIVTSLARSRRPVSAGRGRVSIRTDDDSARPKRARARAKGAARSARRSRCVGGLPES